jgi:SAM-dependent methyltransferase
MTDPVASQYEAYPYPARDPKDETRRLVTGSPSGLDELNHYLFAGARDFRQPFRALVAGGGTGDGAIMLAQQLANRALDLGVDPTLRRGPHEIVYLDLSEASRRVAEARAAARGLANIRFVSGSLFDLPALAPGAFDYIDCCGVLHHLDDPAAGLAALARALAPGGGLGLMLYGEYGRRGVYETQALLRRLDEGLPLAERVGLARRLLAQLPATNWLRRNPFLGDHRKSDAELVDLLLHARDRAYRVPEILALVEGAGLHAVAFIEPARYAPETYVNDAVLAQRFAGLPAPERWAAAEALAGSFKTHVLYASRLGENTVAQPSPLAVPVMTKDSGAALARAVAKDLTIRIDVGGLSLGRAVPALAPAILQRIDGRRSLAEIEAELRQANPALTPERFAEDFAQLYAVLNGFNLLLLRTAATA